jgi:ribosomal protein S18 acetylase RimI-like enzyme
VSPREATLQRIPPGAGRERFVPLLLLADESERAVRAYLQLGDLYVYRVGPEDVAGLVLVLPRQDGSVELKAVAVEPALQKRGIGTRMLAAVMHVLRAQHETRVVVGTGNAGIGQLAFYQKAGFRLLSVERDFFTAERGYPALMEENGIRLRDMVWMDLELGPSESNR